MSTEVAVTEPARGKIHAYATKDFFIDMLTRDIGNADAILELVDNAVDRAIDKYDLDVSGTILEGRKAKSSETEIVVEVTYNKNLLSVEDTSGGIDSYHLANEVFVFGNPNEREERTGLGAYGIGMKRAFFKIGRLMRFRTKVSEEDESALIWDAEEWRKKEEWDLDFTPLDSVGIELKHSNPGTMLQIEELTEMTRKSFDFTPFQTSLRDRIRSSYSIFMDQGVKIFLNGEKMESVLPSLAFSADLAPAYTRLRIGDVDVVIMVGLTPWEDNKSGGWYVFCNGRMVVERDRGELTGWGYNDFPAFHPKFNHVCGFVFFSSQNPRDLPWTTTKRGLDRESVVYQQTLTEMRLLARPVIRFMDGLYRESATAAESSQKEALEGVNQVSPLQVKRENVVFQATPPTVKKQSGPKMVNISFQRPETMVKQVKRSLGDERMPNYKVGEQTFDYYVEQEI